MSMAAVDDVLFNLSSRVLVALVCALAAELSCPGLAQESSTSIAISRFQLVVGLWAEHFVVERHLYSHAFNTIEEEAWT